MKAADRILLIPPISEGTRSLKTSTGFNFDPTGDLAARVRTIMASSLEISTRQNYGAGINQFVDFCNARAIPQEHRYPISEDLLLAFVAFMHGKARASTINNYVSGLATWHRIWNQPFQRGDAVGPAIKALEKSGPPPLPLRPPVNPADLRKGVCSAPPAEFRASASSVRPYSAKFPPPVEKLRGTKVGRTEEGGGLPPSDELRTEEST
ncbi:hypothetical protein CF326_g8865 [Tilletia indica]|nr:hypothetical protein CF326_g8865 [Tilletia indica]